MTLEDGWNIIYKNGKIDSAIVVENGRIDGDPEESWTRYGYTFDPAVVLTKAEYDALVAAAQDAEYEPVPNGTYNNVTVSDDRLYLRISYKAATVYLPDTWRLMRPRQEPQQ